jgi:chromate reductase
MKVAILSGTSRSGNNTIRVAKAIKKLHEKQNDEVRIVDFRNYDLPFFNGPELDHDNPSDFQRELVESWGSAELVYILSPEYNWLITPELSNMTNHYSGARHNFLFNDKVFAFGGVSTGIGGRLPTMQLSSVFEKLIFYMDQQSVCSPNKFESHYTHQELDEEGNFLQDSGYEGRLQNFVNYSKKLCLRFKP